MRQSTMLPSVTLHIRLSQNVNGTTRQAFLCLKPKQDSSEFGRQALMSAPKTSRCAPTVFNSIEIHGIER